MSLVFSLEPRVKRRFAKVILAFGAEPEVPARRLRGQRRDISREGHFLNDRLFPALIGGSTGFIRGPLTWTPSVLSKVTRPMAFAETRMRRRTMSHASRPIRARLGYDPFHTFAKLGCTLLAEQKGKQPEQVRAHGICVGKPELFPHPNKALSMWFPF